MNKKKRPINVLKIKKTYPDLFMKWFLDSGISQMSIDVSYKSWLAGRNVTDQEKIQMLLDNDSWDH